MKYLIRLINVTSLVSVLLRLRSGATASSSFCNVLWKTWFIYLQHLLSYMWVATAGLQNLSLIDQLQGKAFSRAGWRGTGVWLDCNQRCFIFCLESPRLVAITSPGHESCLLSAPVCPLNISSCRAGQGWVMSARIRESCRRTPSFLYEHLSVFRPFLQQNMLCESRWATCCSLPGLVVSGVGLGRVPTWADTWGSVEGVGIHTRSVW